MARPMYSWTKRWWVALEWIEDVLIEGRRLGAETEVYVTTGKSVTAEVRKGSIDRVSGAHGTGLGVRVILEGRIGASSTNDPHLWHRCLDAAIAAANVATSQPWEGLPGPGAKDGPPLSADSRVVPESSETVRLVTEMMKGAAEYPVAVTSGSATMAEGRTMLANTSGAWYEVPHTVVSLSLETICGQSPGYEFGQSVGPDIDPVAIGKKAASLAYRSQDGSEIPTGDYDVVLSPIASSQLLGAVLLPALSGRNVHAGRSPLAGSMGISVADPAFSLVDDPHLPRGLGSTWWDAEGTPTRRIPFISEGILTHFAYDRKTAFRYGAVSTGSAVRSGPGGAPAIGFHNIVVSGPGGDLQEGTVVCAHDLIGAHTANPMSGDLSVELANPFLIRDGNPAQPVRKAMLSGNVFSMIRDIAAFGDDIRQIGGTYLPSIRFKRQHIVGI
ncbi:MAG: metallopeptidase TldD-related protein [Methanomicrobiales archaeon]|nr:metallopeptidase TldD-related protein [Methanomicrobiales archaeon]